MHIFTRIPHLRNKLNKYEEERKFDIGLYYKNSST